MTYKTILTHPTLSEDTLRGGIPIGLIGIIGTIKLIAIGYENDVKCTYLFAAINDRVAQLLFFSDLAHLGLSQQPASKHAHVSRLSENPLPYADALDVDEFIIRMNRNKDILPLRFPDWEIIENTPDLIVGRLRVRE